MQFTLILRTGGENMQNHLDEVYRVLNTFCRSTGIGAMCFGKELNIVAVCPSQTTANDFLSLGTGKLTQFLLQLLSQDTDEKSLYIYEIGRAHV